MMTFDSKGVIDSTGAFFIGELERLDQTLHMPLVEFSWGSDIDIRTDVSIADEISSWTNSDFAAMGNMGGQGSISWIGKDSNTIQGVSLDIGKTAQPLHLWGQEIKYTLPELESAMKLGRPVDAQKYEALRLKYQMDIDTLVYNGDSTITATGLVNASNTVITNVANVANGGSGSPLWQNKAPDGNTPGHQRAFDECLEQIRLCGFARQAFVGAWRLWPACQPPYRRSGQHVRAEYIRPRKHMWSIAAAAATLKSIRLSG